jgi:GNAT superfamily N-acetyltransferase
MEPLIRRIRADESVPLRALRLQALADAPMAFGSTLAREEAFTDEIWCERARHGAAGEDRVTFVAEAGDRWVGLATGIKEPSGDPPRARFALVGMFVVPGARGQGVGSALVESVADWARERGAQRVYLSVTLTNWSAIRLYQRCGFRPTGNRQPLDHTPAVLEMEMVREV